MASLAPLGHADMLGHVGGTPVWVCRVCRRATRCEEGDRYVRDAEEWDERGRHVASDRCRTLWHVHADGCLVCSAARTLLGREAGME
jgi:hypothetical protein